MNRLVFFLLILILASCKKPESYMRDSFAGIYEVEDVLMEFYSEEGNLDSTRTFKNLGTVSLMDQFSEYGNLFTSYIKYDDSMPELFYKNTSGEFQMYSMWAIDGKNTSRLFFKSGNPDFILIYTILKRNWRKITMEYVLVHPNNRISYREVLTFKKL